MTFLALTPIQTALLLLITGGSILALYLLKLRHRRLVISSYMLWRRILDDRQANSLLEKLRRIVSILLAVTIGLLIALALARPQIEALTGKNQRIVIVLDTSPTMGTMMSDHRTRWQHATDETLKLLDVGGSSTEFRVVDTSGRTASAFTTDRKELRTLVQHMTLAPATAQFPRMDAAGTDVYFISDGVAISDLPATVKRISVFERAPNVGITAFEIRSIPSAPQGYEAYLEVHNYGSAATDAAITLQGAGNQRVARNVRLNAGGAFSEVFDLTNFEGGGIRANVQSKDDAFAADDSAFSYLPVKRKSRVLLVTTGNEDLVTLLKLDPLVDLSVTEPSKFQESTEFDAYIFDRFAPPKYPGRPALVIGASDVDWLRKPKGTTEKPQITSWAEDNPLMQYVAVHDVSIEHAAQIDATGLTVVAASDQTPLIVASEKPKWVLMTFDLNSSDFALHVGFPVFIENTLAWFSRDSLALRRSPGTVEVPLPNAQIRTIDGKLVPSQQDLNKSVFEALEPGLFTATQGDTHLHIAVNLTNPMFSDVNRSTFKNDKLGVFETHWLQRELFFYLLLAALVLIVVEWFTYHRRLTI